MRRRKQEGWALLSFDCAQQSDIRDYLVEIIWSRLSGRDYLVEIIWSRLSGRDYLVESRDLSIRRRSPRRSARCPSSCSRIISANRLSVIVPPPASVASLLSCGSVNARRTSTFSRLAV